MQQPRNRPKGQTSVWLICQPYPVRFRFSTETFSYRARDDSIARDSAEIWIYESVFHMPAVIIWLPVAWAHHQCAILYIYTGQDYPDIRWHDRFGYDKHSFH